MTAKSFFLPFESLFGAGCLTDLGPELKKKNLKKALIVTDEGLMKAGIVDKVTAMLEENGFPYEVFSGVEPNPTVQNVNDGVMRYKQGDCDFLMAIGGGSPNDCTKAIGILLANGGDIHDYQGLDKSQYKSPVIIAVNTTAGTASEISRAYLITDEETQVKMIMKDRNCMPDIAVNDPELMIGLPPGLTAATGMDALTHAVECYVSTRTFPLTKALAREAVYTIFRYLPLAVKEPENIEAREQMTYAQYMAGMAFGNGGLGMVHSMAHPLGAVYHLGHGISNAVLLPYVCEFNSTVAAKGYAELASFIHPERSFSTDEEGAATFVEDIRKLSSEIGTLLTLSELGVRKEDVPLLAQKALEDGNLGSNPVKPNKEQVEELYTRAL